MEHDFFELYERHAFLNVEVGHNQTADWCIQIFDRKNDETGGRSDPIISIQHCDRKKVFAGGYDLLTDYLSDKYGGY